MAIIAVGYVSILPRASISRDAPHGRTLPRRPASSSPTSIFRGVFWLAEPLRGPLRPFDASDSGSCSIDSSPSVASIVSCSDSVVTGPRLPPSQAPSLRLRRRGTAYVSLVLQTLLNDDHLPPPLQAGETTRNRALCQAPSVPSSSSTRIHVVESPSLRVE
ncbi:hypothetical protein K523DRAFT_58058 [Schizophyllum commune Tattone D]|nr:hypothetical protein K523DRAFT_58058 [Schizophyllum commune Tattone D]